MSRLGRHLHTQAPEQTPDERAAMSGSAGLSAPPRRLGCSREGCGAASEGRVASGVREGGGGTAWLLPRH